MTSSYLIHIRNGLQYHIQHMLLVCLPSLDAPCIAMNFACCVKAIALGRWEIRSKWLLIQSHPAVKSFIGGSGAPGGNVLVKLTITNSCKSQMVNRFRQTNC